MTRPVPAPVAVPALYDAQVHHRRTQRLDRSFRHRVYLWLVDLDALPRLPWPLRAFARFDARDHLGDPDRTIRANVDRWLAGRGIDLRGGRILMLAHARVAGYVFNPLTVYWCHRRDGTLACVVAEVHNTYRERHCYLLFPDADGHAEVPKQFYVSPFLTVAGRYRMTVPVPGERLGVGIALEQDDVDVFGAGLVGVRRPAGTAELVRMLLRHPLLPLWVAALIRGHGVALWLRRLPVVPRPRHQPQEGVS